MYTHMVLRTRGKDSSVCRTEGLRGRSLADEGERKKKKGNDSRVGSRKSGSTTQHDRKGGTHVYLQLSSSRTESEVRDVRLLLIASHERTELRSLLERFSRTNSFSTTNPNDRSLIVLKVSSITVPSLSQWTEGTGRPAGSSGVERLLMMMMASRDDDVQGDKSISGRKVSACLACECVFVRRRRQWV